MEGITNIAELHQSLAKTYSLELGYAVAKSNLANAQWVISSLIDKHKKLQIDKENNKNKKTKFLKNVYAHLFNFVAEF